MPPQAPRGDSVYEINNFSISPVHRQWMTTAAKSITITAFDTVSTTFTDSSGGDFVYDLAIYCHYWNADQLQWLQRIIIGGKKVADGENCNY